MDDVTLSDMLPQSKLIDQLPVGVAIFDRQYKLYRCNPAGAEAGRLGVNRFGIVSGAYPHRQSLSAQT